jgi:hypothetical protein
MSTESLSTIRPIRQRRSRSFWLDATALWAGVAIVAMWLTVLFVGVFGNDFVSNSSGSSTSIPVVVFLLPFVLPASISVARHGFKESDSTDTLRGELGEETRAREELADELSELRAKLPR